MNEIFLFIGSYIAIILIAFFIINWLQRGLLIAFVQVKMSRGRKVLAKIRGQVEDYYRPAFPKDSGLILKFKNEKEKSLLPIIPRTAYYRSVGVTIIDIDEVSKAVFNKNFEVMSTYDPRTMTSIIKRAQMSSQENDKLIVVVIVIVAILFLMNVATLIILNDVKNTIDSFSAVTTIAGANL